ncbi:MAG: DUF308 domain-containing protein [Rhodobacteraceae bacterium]|nr:DUF308 domain-containing protein [Paracoccaceae bacterium]MBR9819752.1 DUF308 domain-containing protein [Paracoccaceae bacterium]
MTQALPSAALRPANSWLKGYYFTRFLFSALWVGLAFTVAPASAGLSTVMLIVYPAWDALANLVDAARNGGLRANRTQALNLGVSTLTTLAIALALTMGLATVIAVFGVWAVLSGLLQLATALRRWSRFGAQWSMILSGAQSALAGVFFVLMSRGEVTSDAIEILAGYVAFGAVYFLISALWLTVADLRRSES